MTEDGVMRHPSFEGMREDKSAKEVGLEKALPVEVATKDETRAGKRVKSRAPKKEAAMLDTVRLVVTVKTSEGKTFLNPTDESQVRSIQGNELNFTNLSKIY